MSNGLKRRLQKIEADKGQGSRMMHIFDAPDDADLDAFAAANGIKFGANDLVVRIADWSAGAKVAHCSTTPIGR